MKISGQNMEVTIPIFGRERTFSEKELISILEKNFLNGTTNQTTKRKVSKVPTEDEWFEVTPKTINQKLFEKNRNDVTREIIIEAFKVMKKNPARYGRSFKTLMPKKTWSNKTVEEIKTIACELGDNIADWVEQALEWAQRISNGETWENICNEIDKANWYRLVIWKENSARLVGGSQNHKINHSPSEVSKNNFYSSYLLNYTVPLIVKYEIK